MATHRSGTVTLNRSGPQDNLLYVYSKRYKNVSHFNRDSKFKKIDCFVIHESFVTCTFGFTFSRIIYRENIVIEKIYVEFLAEIIRFEIP